MQPQKTRNLARLWVFIILFICLAHGRADAHGIVPISASPAPGAILAQPPGQVRLTFAEEVAEAGSSVQVFSESDPQAALVIGGVDLNDPEHTALVANLPQLPEGVYRIVWQVTLVDGDASSGQYNFGIGNVTLPEGPAAKQAKPTPEPAFQIPFWGIGTPILIAGLIVGIWFAVKARSV